MYISHSDSVADLSMCVDVCMFVCDCLLCNIPYAWHAISMESDYVCMFSGNESETMFLSFLRT